MAHLRGSNYCLDMMVPTALIPDDSCVLWCFTDMLLANPVAQT